MPLEERAWSVNKIMKSCASEGDWITKRSSIASANKLLIDEYKKHYFLPNLEYT